MTPAGKNPRSVPSREELLDAVDHLADFMDGLPLTTRVADLEKALLQANRDSVASIADGSDIAAETLASAVATFVDLVYVALDETDREKYVYVLGDAPKRFLETTISTAAWGFTRKSALQRDIFERRWGPADDITISEFRRTYAKDVHSVDLYEILPDLRSEWGDQIE